MGRWASCVVMVLTTACSTFVGVDSESNVDGGVTDAAATTTSSSGDDGEGTSGATETTSGVADTTTAVSDSGVGAASSGSTTEAVVASCEDLLLEDTLPTECSIESVNDASLTINNDCAGVSIEVLWIGYDCVEVSFGTVAPGESVVISSYDTHPWRVRDAEAGVLMREIPPLAGDTTFDVLMR